ncbi:jg27257 [Pararge aegeria aegeria]|uniref:Jg27257 protein n=1 Tax=Pararge aegeria aegeria TaxID=348720 RepID=A0A8S4RUA5_9NEOP|nr:jg27257 [Pararge aegeria aegeria]
MHYVVESISSADLIRPKNRATSSRPLSFHFASDHATSSAFDFVFQQVVPTYLNCLNLKRTPEVSDFALEREAEATRISPFVHNTAYLEYHTYCRVTTPPA